MRITLCAALLLAVAVPVMAQEVITPASGTVPGINQVTLVGIHMEWVPNGLNGHELTVWVAKRNGGVIVPVIVIQKKLIQRASKMPLGSLVFVEGELDYGRNEYGDRILIIKASTLQYLFR